MAISATNGSQQPEMRRLTRREMLYGVSVFFLILLAAFTPNAGILLGW